MSNKAKLIKILHIKRAKCILNMRALYSSELQSVTVYANYEVHAFPLYILMFKQPLFTLVAMLVNYKITDISQHLRLSLPINSLLTITNHACQTMEKTHVFTM